jgi:hypothetical protein
MKIARYILAAVIGASALPALAIPNLWVSGYGQGLAVYNLTNSQGTTFSLNCTSNPDENGIFQHSVLILLPDGRQLAPGEAKDDAMTVVINDEQYWLPPFLGWRNGDNAWYAFIEALHDATQFEVYVGNAKIGSYQASLKNAQKVLPNIKECTNN